MRNSLAACLAVAGVAISANPTLADPGPVTNWLMNEPASLFDLGMLRLKLEVEKYTERVFNNFSPKKTGAIGWAEYDFSKNRITIGYEAKTFARRKFNKSECKKYIANVQILIGQVIDGRPPPVGYSNAAALFSHSQYVNSSEPQNYRKKLDDIFIIEIIMDGGTCIGSMVSSDVVYKDD